MSGQKTCPLTSSMPRNCPDRTPQAHTHAKAAPIAMPARNRQRVMVNMVGGRDKGRSGDSGQSPLTRSVSRARASGCRFTTDPACARSREASDAYPGRAQCLPSRGQSPKHLRSRTPTTAVSALERRFYEGRPDTVVSTRSVRSSRMSPASERPSRSAHEDHLGVAPPPGSMICWMSSLLIDTGSINVFGRKARGFATHAARASRDHA